VSDIHDTAVIDRGATLGENVCVGPHAFIDQDVRIGDDCVIGPNAVILRYTTLGDGCKVHAGAVIGDLPQDLDFADEPSYVKVGANCILREGVTIHRGTKPESVTEIGDDCFLMAFSHCAHNVKLGKGVILANGVLLAGYVEIGEGAILSGLASVHQFVHIGRLAMMGGSSGATMDVLPFMTAKSFVLNTISGPNSVGLRRAGIGAEERKEIKRAFTLLCRSGLTREDALKEIRQSLTSPAAAEICAFVESSKRGICIT
jgi:UDP-N-acetylglucosamine acyltransferase